MKWEDGSTGRKIDSVSCAVRMQEDENVEHVLIKCKAYRSEREQSKLRGGSTNPNAYNQLLMTAEKIRGHMYCPMPSEFRKNPGSGWNRTNDLGGSSPLL